MAVGFIPRRGLVWGSEGFLAAVLWRVSTCCISATRQMIYPLAIDPPGKHSSLSNRVSILFRSFCLSVNLACSRSAGM